MGRKNYKEFKEFKTSASGEKNGQFQIVCYILSDLNYAPNPYEPTTRHNQNLRPLRANLKSSGVVDSGLERSLYAKLGDTKLLRNC